VASAKRNPDKKKRREQSVERKAELAARKIHRRARRSSSVMKGVTADINRRTGDPHMHTRAKTRVLDSMKVTTK
jgi:hypothetical protein